jgi:hypothetical protein
MTITSPALLKGFDVRVVMLSVVDAAGLALPGHSLATDIA